MTPASWSLVALLAVILVSLTSRINVGVLSIALAWLVATIAAGWRTDALMALFPGSLFLTLLGVTLLFGAAERNGSLADVTGRLARLTTSRPGAIPWLFFGVAGAVSSVGPGAIAATALVAPLALATGWRAGISPFLMALMVANGANAGNLSPWSSVGLIVQAQMAKAGLSGHGAGVFTANFVAHTFAALGAWALFRARATTAGPLAPPATTAPPVASMSRSSVVTLAVLGLWILAVTVLKAPPGPSAFVAAAVLILSGFADDRATLGSVPIAVIVMVCGVSVLVGVLEKTGGMDLFSTLLSHLTAPAWANGTMAGVTGLISTYSSTSGVVYPAFLPTVPTVIQKLGGGDPLQLALSINVGAALVDVSPLSTIGALCVAAIPAGSEDPRIVFRRMLIWGFAMVIGGAAFCQVAIGWFAW